MRRVKRLFALILALSSYGLAEKLLFVENPYPFNPKLLDKSEFYPTPPPDLRPQTLADGRRYILAEPKIIFTNNALYIKRGTTLTKYDAKLNPLKTIDIGKPAQNDNFAIWRNKILIYRNGEIEFRDANLNLINSMKPDVWQDEVMLHAYGDTIAIVGVKQSKLAGDSNLNCIRAMAYNAISHKNLWGVYGPENCTGKGMQNDYITGFNLYKDYFIINEWTERPKQATTIFTLEKFVYLGMLTQGPLDVIVTNTKNVKPSALLKIFNDSFSDSLERYLILGNDCTYVKDANGVYSDNAELQHTINCFGNHYDILWSQSYYSFYRVIRR